MFGLKNRKFGQKLTFLKSSHFLAALLHNESEILSPSGIHSAEIKPSSAEPECDLNESSNDDWMTIIQWSVAMGGALLFVIFSFRETISSFSRFVFQKRKKFSEIAPFSRNCAIFQKLRHFSEILPLFG